jgi:predicted transcriptional regulator of viral defense system
MEQIEKLAETREGVIKTSELTSLKIGYRQIQRLIHAGMIENIRQGYYRLAKNSVKRSEMELIAEMFPDGVICMYAALFHYGYSDRTPLKWDIAIDKNVSRARFNINYPYIQPYYLESRQLSYGVASENFGDCYLRVFDRDRLMCECLKYETKMERESFVKAIQTYVSDPRKNVAKLLEYSKLRRVNKKVRERIALWL